MPQMSPMNWFLLMIFFYVIYFFLFVFVYFYIFNFMSFNSNKLINCFSLKWY